jgi:hypothetical protein
MYGATDETSRSTGRTYTGSMPRELVEWIEFEYGHVQKRRDKRLLIEITETTFRVIR